MKKLLKAITLAVLLTNCSVTEEMSDVNVSDESTESVAIEGCSKGITNISYHDHGRDAGTIDEPHSEDLNFESFVEGTKSYTYIGYSIGPNDTGFLTDNDVAILTKALIKTIDIITCGQSVYPQEIPEELIVKNKTERSSVHNAAEVFRWSSERSDGFIIGIYVEKDYAAYIHNEITEVRKHVSEGKDLPLYKAITELGLANNTMHAGLYFIWKMI